MAKALDGVYINGIIAASTNATESRHGKDQSLKPVPDFIRPFYVKLEGQELEALPEAMAQRRWRKCEQVAQYLGH